MYLLRSVLRFYHWIFDGSVPSSPDLMVLWKCVGWFSVKDPIDLTFTMRIFLTTLLSILFLTSSLFGQSSERPESIVVPISSLGDVSETRKQIIQNTLNEKRNERNICGG